MFNLREYQQEIVDKVHAAWEVFRSVLCVCPTGGGKTVIFSSIIAEHNGGAVAVVHRREIVRQISLSLAKMGVKHRIIAPPNTIRNIRRSHVKELGKSFVDPLSLVGVASAQTLTSRSSLNNPEIQRFIKQVSLAVYDEGHHYTCSGTWAKAVDMFAAAKLLFVTATPERADGKGLGTKELGGDGHCEVMVEGPSTNWLIENGFLAPFVYRAPKTDLNVEGLAVTASGDFNAKAMRARVVESHIVGDVVRHYKQFASGKRTIVFATDVQTAEEIAARFRENGFTSVALCGETEQGERDRELQLFEEGKTQVLVNVDLFDEGFDVPAVECVILARPTESLGKYLQMVGRGLRIMKGKTHAIIIDPVRNWERHGGPNWPRVWSLESREKRAGGASDTIQQKVCKGCTRPFEAFYQACPYCGLVPAMPDRHTPEQVDGELIEMDVAAMAALFEKIRKADMPDDEYRVNQIGRNIPQVGRGKDMRRHQAARYRRQVLRELVGWWFGMQPDDRALGEKQRRFYHRFGVDVGTAFTLDEKQTEALIDIIAKRFGSDMKV